jgi:hypothetical protein
MRAQTSYTILYSSVSNHCILIKRWIIPVLYSATTHPRAQNCAYSQLLVQHWSF